MSAVAFGVSTAVGLGEAAVGFFGEKSANKKAKQLAGTRPKLTPSPYLQDELSLAESDLSTGMSGAAKTAYESDMDKSLSTSLGTSLRMGGSPNSVGSIFANSADGRARLAMMKDNLRLSQINNLVRAQQGNEESRQQQFQFNDWAPWADSAQANAQAKATGQSEIFSGLSTAAGGAMRFGQEQSTAKQYAKYFTRSGDGSNNRASANAGAYAEPSNQSAPDTSFLDGLLNGDE